METTKTRQQSILAFAVKTSPHSFMHHPSPPMKRSRVEKRQPGNPRKKPRQDEDWRQHWHDAVENDRCSSVRVSESYESSTISHFADKPSKEPVRPKKFEATYRESLRYDNSHLVILNVRISK